MKTLTRLSGFSWFSWFTRACASMILAGQIGMAHAHEAEALVTTAEQALASGRTADALAGFEQAAATRHDAEIEMGLVRTLMQTGSYREALAFCAHTAGGHPDTPAAAALYAWLLRAGGQDAFAGRLLSKTLAIAPDDPVAQATFRAFEAGGLAASGVLLELPHRMAPQMQMQGGQAIPSPGTRSVSSGVLVDGGQRALVPLAAVDGARKLWVRNGLGHTTEAVVDSGSDRLHALGLSVLRLVAPLDQGTTLLAPTDPFAGSPGSVVEYPLTSDAIPAWPTLHEGFLGAFTGRDGWRRLGIDVPPGRRGGPVFDAAGRLAGISLQGTSEVATMLPVSMFRDDVWMPSEGIAPTRPTPTQASGRMQADETYEHALKLALQVLALP